MNKPKRIRRSLLKHVLLLFLIPILSIHAQTNETLPNSAANIGDKIYVITNRAIDTTCKNLSFNCEVIENKKLTYLKVSPNKSGELINDTLSYTDFMTQICAKKSDWLLFVHGDSKTYNQSVKRGIEIQQYHQINVIVFSWPSKDPHLHGLRNLNNSKRNVLKSKNHFNEVLTLMDSFKRKNKAFDKGAKLSLLIHSLGNVYLKNCSKEPRTKLETKLIFDNVIMNSAAVNQNMHQDWVEQINFQKRIYITNNKSDFNLKGLHIFSKAKNQLGEKAKAPIAKNANYVQFSKAVGFRIPTGTSHTFFIGRVPNKSKNIRSFYHDVFHGIKIDFSDQSQYIKRKNEIGYSVIF